MRALNLVLASKRGIENQSPVRPKNTCRCRRAQVKRSLNLVLTFLFQVLRALRRSRTHLSLEDSVEPLCRLELEGWGDGATGVERHRDLGVPGPLLDDLWVDAVRLACVFWLPNSFPLLPSDYWLGEGSA